MLISLVMPPNPQMKINGQSVYRLYVMIKQHFTGKFDIIKYKWSGVRISNAVYEKRRDKYFFERLASKFTLGELYRIFLANLLANPDAWVGEISGADALMFFNEYKGKLDRASYIFKEDLENLTGFCKKKNIKFTDLFRVDKGHPVIFKMLQQDVISYETFILIDAAGGFIHKLDAEFLKKDEVWEQYSPRIRSYQKLLDVNRNDARKILLETLKK